jgi:hypothetical protein
MCRERTSRGDEFSIERAPEGEFFIRVSQYAGGYC